MAKTTGPDQREVHRISHTCKASRFYCQKAKVGSESLGLFLLKVLENHLRYGNLNTIITKRKKIEMIMAYNILHDKEKI